jgi:Phosphoribosyl-ATP pyrophosphohydrolase
MRSLSDFERERKDLEYSVEFRPSLIDDTDAFYEKFFQDLPAFSSKRLEWRYRFLQEEMKELDIAMSFGLADDIVDALIDIIVVALGTLKEAKVDIGQAWTTVHDANMEKVRGTKESRFGSEGYDLAKPEGWKAPSHEGNHGVLDNLK